MMDITNADGEEAVAKEQTDETADVLRDAERVVAAFGGVRPMASRLGMAATTIQGWKSRGHIPESRRQAVLEAAEADGIDLSGLRPKTIQDAPEPPETDAAASAVAATQPRQGGNGVAWLALILAGLVGIAVVTQPRWSPVIYGVPSAEVPSALIDRIAVLESRPVAPDLTRRVAAAEKALDDIRARDPAAIPPDLTPRLRALSARIDKLTQALDAAKSEGRAANDGRAADLSALREALETLSDKLERAVVDTAQTSARKSSVIVAVGALDVALGDGLPYGYALNAVKRLALSGEAAIADSIAILSAHAETGIPTRLQLAGRLDALVASRGSPVWTAEGDSWTDKVLRKINSVISIRRIDDAEGSAEKLLQAQKALKKNDLRGAAGALRDAVGPAKDWAGDAQRRIAADQALSKLRLWAIRTLDDAGTKKTPTQ